MSDNPYQVQLHTAREIQAAASEAFSPRGTDADRHAMRLVNEAVLLMGRSNVRCIICDGEVGRRAAYIALVVHMHRQGWGAGVVCRRCGNRHRRRTLIEEGQQRAQLVFAPPQGHG